MKSGCNGENNDYSIITHKYLHGRANLSHTQNGENGLLLAFLAVSIYVKPKTKNQKGHAYRTTVVPLYTRSSLVCSG